jgi:methyl-accepting chemotaxis protein
MSVVLVITISLTWVSYSFSKQLIMNGVNERLKDQTHRYVNDIQKELLSNVLTPQTLAPVMAANGSLNGNISYEAPYLDQSTGSATVKAKVPYYDENQTFLGFATQDIALDNIQQLVGGIAVGTNGSAFLIDKTGLVLSSKDYTKIMTENLTKDPNESLAKLALQMIKPPVSGEVAPAVEENPSTDPSASLNEQPVTQEGTAVTEGMGTYSNLGRTMRVYYATVPNTRWLLALSIPESELYGPLFKLFEPMISIIILSCVIVAIFAHLFNRYILKNVRDINRLAIAMSEGDFTKRTQMRSGNELQRLGIALTRHWTGYAIRWTVS